MQDSDGGGGLLGLLLGGGMMVFMFVVFLFFAACGWKIYAKAGKPGWAALVPIYNQWVMMEIVGFPGIYMLAFFVPFINMLFGLFCVYRLAKVFGKDMGYTIGLILLSPIFYPLLAFGDSEYLGPEAAN